MRTVSQGLRRARYRRPVLRRPLVWWRHQGLSPEDVLVVSYPRSGTTWLRFLLFEAVTGRSAEFESVNQEIPYAGKHRGTPALLPQGGRLIQTHDVYGGASSRVLYIVRDPRAVVVSEYQWELRTGLYAGTFEAFFQDFLRGRANPFARWDVHVNFWLQRAGVPKDRLHLVKFESLRHDTAKTLGTIMQFLEVPVAAEEIERVISNNSIDLMRKKEDRAPQGALGTTQRPDVRFVGKGSTESWRHDLTTPQRTLIETTFAQTLDSLGYGGS